MDEQRIGVVEHYYPKAQAAVVRVEDGPLHLGDVVHFRGHGDDVVTRVERIEVNHRAIQEAQPGQSVGVEVHHLVHEKAEVFRVLEEPGIA